MPSPEERLDFTGERFVPGTSGEIEHEHYHRYLFALELCRGRDVLDVASGEGYGSALLATVARSVVGVELVPEVVQHAQRNYPRPELTFRVGDCARLPVDSGSVDVVVSFETIEHLDRQEEFLAEVKRVLRPAGLLVMSSPRRGIYSPGNPNPFHVKELTRNELRALAGEHFRHVATLGQTPIVGSAILAESESESGASEALSYWRQEDGSFDVEAGIGPSPYLLLVASDESLPSLHVGLLQDRPYMARLLGALQAANDHATTRAADVERLSAQVAELEQQLAASQAHLDDTQRAISVLEQANRDQADRLSALDAEVRRLAAEAKSARKELEARTAPPARTLEAIARLEREMELLTGVRGSQSTRAGLPKAVVRAGSRARKALAALQPARLRHFRHDRHLNRLVRRLAATGLFDSDYYLTRNQDVVAAGEDPIRHYLTHGAAEGRDPHAMFDTSYYLHQNPDVAASGTNPLLHFALSGLNEGRRPHPGFSAEQFRQAALAAGERKGSTLRALSPRPRRAQAPVRFRPRALSEPAAPLAGASPPVARTLIVSHVLPYPPRAGNEYRLHQIIQWLESIGHEVLLVVSPLAGEAPELQAVERAAREYPNLVVCQRDGSLLYRSQRTELQSMLASLAGERPRSFPAPAHPRGVDPSARMVSVEQAFCPDPLVDLLLRLEKAGQPEMVIANYVFMSRFLPMLGKRVLKLIDTIDVFSTKSHKVVQFGVSDALAITREEEAALLHRADLLIAIQPDEEDELRSLAPDRRIVTAGVDFQVAADVGPPRGDPAVLYVASKNPLNVKGVHDFLSLIWPLVRREVPKARMLIVGPICDAVEEGIPGVQLLGRVNRLDDVYAEAKVVVNLAVAGTGLKVKTLEALSYLRPIVVWPCGIDGLSPEIRRFCEVAHDWYDFGRRVVRQLTADRAVIVEHREELRKSLSPEVVYRPLRDAIEAGMQAVTAREVRQE